MKSNLQYLVETQPVPTPKNDMTFSTNQNESDHTFRVAIPEWSLGDGIARMIEYELYRLGHEPVVFPHDSTLPEDIDILLTFAPYSKVMRIWEQAAQRDGPRRPVVIHWNTEGLPDLRIPFPVIRKIGHLRSKLGRLSYSESAFDRLVYKFPLLSLADGELMRFRHYGDYEYAYRKGWLHLLFDSSKVYCNIRNQNGLPTGYAPWGSSSIYYQDLGLERDIDVLWMGARGSFRRNRILNFVTRELIDQGVKIHIADNEMNPFIYNDDRTEYLNRSKITLNITRTWYDDNFSRFSMAAPNRSMIVSEPMLPHCIEFKENIHYVSAEIKELPKTILYYLEHENKREKIVENAYQLVTTQLQFANSLKTILSAAARYRNTQKLTIPAQIAVH